MTIETKLDFKRYLRLMYMLTYRKPMMIFLTFIGIIMFVGSILWFLDANIPFDSPPYFQFVLGLSIVFLLPLTVYTSGKKNYFTHGRLQEKIIYQFSDDKIQIMGESFNSELDWAKTYKIVELKEWVLIYQNRQIANIIPKDAFGDHIIQFRSLVRHKNIKAKLR